MKKRIRKRRIILGILLALLLGPGGWALHFAMNMPTDAFKRMGEDARRFATEHPGGFQTLGTLHCAVAGSEAAPVVLYFIHGAPGDWKAFSSYLVNEALQEHYRMVVPDRPGYGGSTPGLTVGRFADQAERLIPLAEAGGAAKKIWIGHSFGAPIIAKLAADHPELVDGMIFLGGAMSVQYERKKWYHRLGDTRLGRKIMSDDWRVANEEAIAFEAEFVSLEADWKKITCPVTIMHALDDSLADYRHVDFAVKELINAEVEVVKLEEGDHFFLWTDPAVVIKALDELAAQLTKE